MRDLHPETCLESFVLFNLGITFSLCFSLDRPRCSFFVVAAGQCFKADAERTCQQGLVCEHFWALLSSFWCWPWHMKQCGVEIQPAPSLCPSWKEEQSLPWAGDGWGICQLAVRAGICHLSNSQWWSQISQDLANPLTGAKPEQDLCLLFNSIRGTDLSMLPDLSMIIFPLLEWLFCFVFQKRFSFVGRSWDVNSESGRRICPPKLWWFYCFGSLLWITGVEDSWLTSISMACSSFYVHQEIRGRWRQNWHLSIICFYFNETCTAVTVFLLVYGLFAPRISGCAGEQL